MTADEFLQQPQCVQDRVLEANRTILVDYGDWWDYVYDCFKEDMAALGILVEGMYFSGFWSQGDGACFEGRVSDFSKLFDVPEFAKYLGKHGMLNEWDFYISWKHSGRYYHEHSLSYDCNWSGPDTDDDNPLRQRAKEIEADDNEKIVCGLEEAIADFVREQCSKLYKSLEEEYEHLTSDESIIEHLEINECLADEVREAREHLDVEDEEHEHTGA